MKISDQNRTLDAHYQKEVKAKEAKLKEVKDSYNKKIQEVKESSDDEVRINRNKERERISKELEEEKEKWDEVRKKWKEKEAILEFENQKGEIRNQQELEVNRIRHGKLMESDQNQFNKDINFLKERGNDSLREMQESVNAKIYREDIKSRNNIDSLRKENERLENLAIKSYSNFSREQQREIDKAVAEKEREHRTILKNLKEENARQLNERDKVNQEDLKRKDEANKNKLLNAEKGFNKRIEQMKNESEKTISNYASKSQKELNRLKQNESREKNLITDKSKDPFYSITNLNPQLSEGEKEYTLKLSVPEHEKDSVILGGDKRTLKISQTRRFSDESKNENGTVNKSARSEAISQIVNLKDIINPRKITQSYQNNELIFKIPKA